jgi:hypothetical protein
MIGNALLDLHGFAPHQAPPVDGGRDSQWRLRSARARFGAGRALSRLDARPVKRSRPSHNRRQPVPHRRTRPQTARRSPLSP